MPDLKIIRRWLIALLLVVSSQAASKPKLVVAIIVDQFRYDYMTRFDGDYHEGLRKLHDSGAFFTDGHEAHFPTVTAVGHAAFMTGSIPAIDGIVGNEWFDRETGKTVTSVSDDGTKLVGGNGGVGSSPKRLVVTTLGDEIKATGPTDTEVIGISLKDRAAILPSGHAANAAYWFEHESGQFVTSTYYMKELPAWVQAFNKSDAASKYASAKWGTFRTLPSVLGKPYYEAMIATPYGNDMLEAFAEDAIKEEHLGRHSGTDVLTVSFSSNDLLGHQVGPDAPEVRDTCIQTDRVLGRLLRAVDTEAGAGNYVVVFSSDHGVAPKPEELTKRGIPAGRFSGVEVSQTIESALSEKYGPGKWIVGRAELAPYLDHDLLREKHAVLAEAQEIAADAVRKLPYIFRVYTGAQLEHENLAGDPIGVLMQRGYYRGRAADLFIIQKPYWLASQSGTSHGTPFSYDTHVPVIFLGHGIRPGRYDENVRTADIAPTLAALLGVNTPSGSVGRVLPIIEK
ncbi:MAG: alkaline phosphatase family protein [Bryobacteraceae bacterium]|jgi:predicted AlkP superfamily pyrophosphatase or phosphodiesterase